MKNSFKLFSLSFLIVFVIMSCSNNNADDDPSPADAGTGSISSKFNGTTWSGAWCTGLNATFGSTKVIAITGQLSEKNNSEGVTISINAFAGVGTYTFDGTSLNSKITVNYSGKSYISTPLPLNSGGGGSGTIKVTEYVAPRGILNPGKVVGEFSGTIKSMNSTTEQISVTNGKFTAVIVL
jgi:hypothetical protein